MGELWSYVYTALACVFCFGLVAAATVQAIRRWVLMPLILALWVATVRPLFSAENVSGFLSTFCFGLFKDAPTWFGVPVQLPAGLPLSVHLGEVGTICVLVLVPLGTLVVIVVKCAND